MMKNDRASLIARKQEVLRELTRAQRQLEAIRSADNRHQLRQQQQLENEVEQLMAEEYRLRIAIDRSR
ncbi:MAG: hypothetical protein OXC27_10090 [Caldilineaceae bacterium]|nr:hypothetical protein [Caldilineaceae bacterium]